MANEWISLNDRAPNTDEGDWVLGWHRAGYYKLVMLDKNGNIPNNLVDDIVSWCSIPDPPDHK